MPNPTISQITMPSGNVYDIADAVARATIAGAISILGVSINALAEGDTTNPISIGDLTTSEPADWATDYTNYYTYSTATGTFTAVTGESAPTWESNTYYAAKSVTVYTNNAVLYAKKELLYAADEHWHEFGDLTGLGDLAFKDSASATYTPAGTVAVSSAGASETLGIVSVSVSGESLIFNSTNKTVKTGDASYGFTGTQATITST